MEVFQWEERDQTTPFYIHMIAGSFAGIAEHLSLIPVDNVKTHCQVGRSLPISQIIRKIYNAGGLSNFYAGSSVVLAGCIPAHALYFSLFEQTKKVLNCNPEVDMGKYAVIGAISALSHDLIMTPTEVLKQRLQLARSESTGVKAVSLAKKILKQQGIIAFYRSFFINYTMNIPKGSLVVMFNQKLKHLLGAKDDDHGFKFYLSGGIAGGIASIPTTPLDVIKTKLNTQFCESSNCEKMPLCNILRTKIQRNNNTFDKFEPKGKLLWTQNRQSMSTIRNSVKYKNIVDTTMTIWRQQGLKGFFRGVQMRFTIQSISSGIAWGTYQSIKGLMVKNQF